MNEPEHTPIPTLEEWLDLHDETVRNIFESEGLHGLPEYAAIAVDHIVESFAFAGGYGTALQNPYRKIYDQLLNQYIQDDPQGLIEKEYDETKYDM